jgi:hypothetical protein
MNRRLLSLAAGTLLSAVLSVGPLQAAGHSWALDGEASRVAYGSIKADIVGEVNTFTSLSGSISADGMVAVEIDLSSVSTNIDIRNERMIEHVFMKASSAATLNAQLDMATIDGMSAGDSNLVDVVGSLNLNGLEMAINTVMFVAKLDDNTLMATTNDMIMLSTADAGIDDGIDTLMELAGLPSIARVAPVTLRLVFTHS